MGDAEACAIVAGSKINIEFRRQPEWPKLAWHAVFLPHEDTVVVTHGPWVETFPGGFFEGIWDGPFNDAAFDSSPNVFGSGAVIRGRTITFVSSTSTTDYLYWWSDKAGVRVEVANSLPLLLGSLGDRLDPKNHTYASINNSITSGIVRYERRIPSGKGAVNRVMHANLTVAGGQVHEHDKPLPPRFSTFGEYHDYVSASYARLAGNARDANRSQPMAIFSTQSKGYDSTAANAIAKEFGIDKVFTVTKGKANGYFADEDRQIETDDDGTEICKFFDLPCVPIDRRAAEREQELEYLFHASMHENADFNLQEIARHVLRPTVLITGCLGELWYTKDYYQDHPHAIDPYLIRGDLGNHGLTEVRLQAGYAQLSFPYIGARSREDIYRITESSEMEPWRLHCAYDRPIPRRIAEEAGLPRSMFGQKKMASVLEFAAPALPLGAQLRREFLAFLVETGILKEWQCRFLPFARRWNTIVTMVSPKRHLWLYYLERVVSRLLGRPYTLPLLCTRVSSMLFCYCVNRRVLDYVSTSERPDVSLRV